METQERVGRSADWRLWRNWGLAFVGFPLGGLAAQAIAGGIETALEAALGGLAAGAVIGGMQWLALRQYLRLSPWWIAATSAGMAAGMALGVALLGTTTAGNVLLVRGAVTGLAIGAAQWLVLRRSVPQAFVWVLTVTVGWALGWAVTRAAGVDLAPNFANFGATGAWAFQALTGVVLAWLLRQRASLQLQFVHN